MITAGKAAVAEKTLTSEWRGPNEDFEFSAKLTSNKKFSEVLSGDLM